MAKSPPKLSRTVSETNLARLDVDRLAGLLMAAAESDPGFRRRLRLELAAEIGAPELALELDKRIQVLATSRARISWRKRPELIRELRVLHRLVVDRLAELDGRLALDRLVAWHDLYAPLSARTKDAKGELVGAFDEAAADLGALASRLGPDIAAPVLAEAVSTRSTQWAAFIGRAAPHLSPEVARGLLERLAREGATAGKRSAMVIRRLADRCGNLDAWLASLGPDDRRTGAFEVEVARRLALAGRAAEARAALDAAKGRQQPKRWGAPDAAPDDAWFEAEILVLEAEGDTAEAEDARWRQFERTLSPDLLKSIVADLADFEDVVVIDRATAYATTYFDLTKGLAFLMAWGALREAAEAIVARRDDLRGGHDDIPLWASRLSGRYPLAAVLLLRARISALAAMGAGGSDEVALSLGEAEALAATVPDGGYLPSHEVFVETLPRRAIAPAVRRRR